MAPFAACKTILPLLAILSRSSQCSSDGEASHANGTWGEGGLAKSSSPSGSFCCSLLSRIGRNDVSFPGSPQYVQEQSGAPLYGYWSAIESDQQPACRYTPSAAADLAPAVKVLASNNCEFAIRSGGHTPFANASNIEGGVTFDLSSLNRTVVSPDKTQASIGPGARWGDVYNTLDSLGLAVSGGRVSSVGVGGLTLGGGKSFFASLYGFVADNVNNFEVVIANGSILEANSGRNADLYKALKGGTSNFGIVTRFDVRTFPQGPLWGGQVVYPVSTISQQLDALASFDEVQGAQKQQTSDAQVIFAFVTMNTAQIIANFYSETNASLSQNGSFPPAFSNFSKITPALEDDTRVDQLSNFATELNTGTPNGLRYLFGTKTFINNAQLYKDMVQIANKTFEPFVAAGTPNITFSFVYQPLTNPMLSHGCGKNVLGLCPVSGPQLMILDLTMSWGSAADDAKIYAAAESLLNQTTSLAQQRGLLAQYEYLNYAAQFQDPISSYGATNVRFLQQVSKKYDPQGAFQRLGKGFKIPGLCSGGPQAC